VYTVWRFSPLWLKQQYSQFKIFFLFTINLKAFHRIQRSGALKNILCIFISIGTVRGTKRGRLRKTNKPWAWSSTPSPGGWSPTRLSTVLRLASHFLTQRCIFFCFRILTQSKALHNFLAWRWCSNDRPRKTNYYREIGICSFTLNLGKTNFYTSPLKKLPWRRVIAVYCVQYYDWSTFKVFMCEKNMFYCWGFS